MGGVKTHAIENNIKTGYYVTADNFKSSNIENKSDLTFLI